MYHGADGGGGALRRALMKGESTSGEQADERFAAFRVTRGEQ